MSEVFILFLLLLLTESLQNASYKFHRLEEVCHASGRKVRMTLGDAVHVYTYNSTTARHRNVKCHLELAVTNSLWGFSVFIQEISLGSGSVSGGGECDNDNYLQFGRDILFVTTHLSSKLCDNSTALQHRHYTEIEDTEMDVWLVVTNRKQREQKTVIMVVTPVHKSSQCKDRAGAVHLCGSGRYCISRQLRCDGRVNCLARDGRRTDESGCEPPPSNASTQTSVWPPASSVVGCLCLGLVVVLAGLVAARSYRRRRAREKMARIRRGPPDLLSGEDEAPLPPPPSCPPPPYTIDTLPEHLPLPAPGYSHHLPHASSAYTKETL